MIINESRSSCKVPVIFFSEFILNLDMSTISSRVPKCEISRIFFLRETHSSMRIDQTDVRTFRLEKAIYSLFSTTWCVQVLRSPKEAFAAAMQLWRERCEKCICLQGDYVENGCIFSFLW